MAFPLINVEFDLLPKHRFPWVRSGRRFGIFVSADCHGVNNEVFLVTPGIFGPLISIKSVKY